MTDTGPIFDQQVKLHELQKRDAERALDIHQSFITSANQALIESGNIALRMGVIINGGAAVAMLAFIGGLVGHGTIKPGPQMNALTFSLVWFAVGVAVGTLALGFVYFTNWCILQTARSQTQSWQAPWVSDTAASMRWRRAAGYLGAAPYCLDSRASAFSCGGCSMSEALSASWARNHVMGFHLMRFVATVLFVMVLQCAIAEIADVKYRGPVDLKPFACTDTQSSFVHRVCFDKANSYMLIKLKDTWYHYCSISDATVTAMVKAESVGRYFNANVKGQFDCRVHPAPNY